MLVHFVNFKKKHVTTYAEYEMELVHSIPLSCGKVYIGQTEGCANDRAREHASSLRSSPSGTFTADCDKRGRQLAFPRLKITRNSKAHPARD